MSTRACVCVSLNAGYIIFKVSLQFILSLSQ